MEHLKQEMESPFWEYLSIFKALLTRLLFMTHAGELKDFMSMQWRNQTKERCTSHMGSHITNHMGSHMTSHMSSHVTSHMGSHMISH